MKTLSSRPISRSQVLLPTPQEVAEAAAPAVNLLGWLSSMIVFKDTRMESILYTQGVLEDALDCLKLEHYIVYPQLTSIAHVHYDVEIFPYPQFVVLHHAQFRIIP